MPKQAPVELPPRDAETFVESFEKGLRVLTAFDETHTAMTLSEVAERTQLTRAAARRLLWTLVELRYAVVDDKRFSLTARVLQLGHAYLRSSSLSELAKPQLERVSQELGESASVAVLDCSDIVYVARAAKRRIMAVDLGVGARLPAFCTSMGRVLWAHHPDREQLLANTTFVRHTDKTIVAKAKLRELLTETKLRGHCLVDQELEIGLRSIAVPVVDLRGRVVAAMNVSGQASRVTLDEMRRTFLPSLQRAATDLGRALP